VIGVILAGGASRRFGGAPKGAQLLHGKPLALHGADALKGICSRVLLEDNGDQAYGALGLARISASPAHAGKGPLAGMAAGLRAAGDRVAFAPCDMPMLTTEMFHPLAAHPSGAYAISPSGIEPLVCVLPASALGVIEAALDGDEIPRVVDVLSRVGAVGVAFAEARPFANVNTPEELARL
jgi:molybdopterin-guanine dinucleotide biosynthesis protein A